MPGMHRVRYGIIREATGSSLGRGKVINTSENLENNTEGRQAGRLPTFHATLHVNVVRMLYGNVLIYPALRHQRAACTTSSTNLDRSDAGKSMDTEHEDMVQCGLHGRWDSSYVGQLDSLRHAQLLYNLRGLLIQGKLDTTPQVNALRMVEATSNWHRRGAISASTHHIRHGENIM